MRHENYTYSCGCPVEAALEVIGGKWKGVILFHLLNSTKRFNELKSQMPKITQRTLTLQLRELERDRVIVRKIYAEVPPKVEYSLTEFGMSLEPILLALGILGQKYLSQRPMELQESHGEPEAVENTC